MTDQPWSAPGSQPGPPSGRPPPGSPPQGPGQPPAGFRAPGSPPPGPPHPGYLPPGAPNRPGGPGGPPPGAYTRFAVRPGIIPLRPLGLGDLYGAVFSAVRGNPGATIGLATITTFVFVLPATALGAWLAGRVAFDAFGTSGAASDALPEDFGLGLVGQYLPSVGQVFSSILLAGFLAQVVGQAVLGRTLGAGATWRATRGRVPAMLGAVLLTVLATVLVLALFVGLVVVLAGAVDLADGAGVTLAVLVGAVVGLVVLATLLYLSTAWGFATSAVVLERRGPVGGLGRSTRLVGSPLAGPFWRVFGIRLLTSVIVGVGASVVAVPIAILVLLGAFALLGESGLESRFLVIQTIASGIAGLVTGALTTPFTAGVDALLYVDARIRREGLDVRLVQTAQGAAEPPWPLV